MLTKIIAGLIVLAAVIHGVAPDLIPENILPLALVILGLVHGAINVEEGNRNNILILAIAVGGASAVNVLANIHMIGGYLDGILDGLAIAGWSIVVAVLVLSIWEIMTADGDSSGDGGE